MAIDRDVPIQSWMTRGTLTVSYAAPLDAAERLMESESVRHLPVVDGDELVGILSEREVKLAVAMSGFRPERMTVGEVCTPIVYTVSPETLVSEVAETMAQKRYGSCVVVDERRKVLGIFTTTDACAALAAALEG